MPPTSEIQPRWLEASAAAGADAGFADEAADDSSGAEYWRLSGGVAIVASLIVQVTGCAPVRIDLAPSQVRGRPPRRSLLPFDPTSPSTVARASIR